MFLIFQVRLESIEAVNKMLEEANKRIQPTGTCNLLGTFSPFSFFHFDYWCLLIIHLLIFASGSAWSFKRALV